MIRAILSKPYAARVELKRLSPEQSKVLAQELLGVEEIPQELEQLIVDKTEGNPLFVEELTRSLLESGDLVRRNGVYILTRPVEALNIPTTVQGVLLARIDRLREELKQVLQVASVIGRVFSYPVLAQVIGVTGQSLPQGLEEMLAQLEDLEFIYPTSITPHREYSFKHVLTQEAVYQTLLARKREEYHERVGEALEELYPDQLEEYYELLAYHYVRSGNKEKAFEYLDLANQKAAKAYAMEEAKKYFDEAMKVLDILPEAEVNQRRRISLLVNQRSVMLLLIKLPEYYDLLTRYEAMANRLRDPGLLGAFYACLGHCDWWFASLDQAIQTCARAVELCEAARNAEDAGYAYSLLQWCHLGKGDYNQVLVLKEDVLRNMEQRFNPLYYMWSLTATSWA
ncbi:MAG: hypothetical protein L0Y56_20585, partial [Nitrospira sp.]|nr:hypothetical protein [Nitrospira sp.]